MVSAYGIFPAFVRRDVLIGQFDFTERAEEMRRKQNGETEVAEHTVG